MAGSELAPRRLLLAVTSPIALNLLVLPQLAPLRRAGWEVHLVCGAGDVSPEVREGAAAVHMVPLHRAISPVRDVGSLAAMLRLIRRVRPSVVIGGTPKASMISLMSARAARVPVRIFHVWGAAWDGKDGAAATLLRTADRASALAATDLLAVSPSLARLLVARGVTRRTPVVLGRGGSKGVDTTVFHPGRTRPFDPSAPLIGFAGRLSIDKGVDDLVAVIERVRSTIPGATLQVAGDIDDAQPIDAALVRALRSSDAIDWIGPVPQRELARRMRDWDLLLFPSHREGLPNVVIECAASGVPAVGWRVTGVRDAIDAPRTGMLVERGDLPAMVDAVLQCLEPGTHEHMSANAAEWARTNFDSHVLQELFVGFLADRLAHRG